LEPFSYLKSYIFGRRRRRAKVLVCYDDISLIFFSTNPGKPSFFFHLFYIFELL
jgi:hypothetical protein